MSSTSRIALITGASSGIGMATAQSLAALGGFRLILCGRRTERLEALAAELTTTGTPCHTLTFDVADRLAVQEAIASLPADFAELDVLINNAGNAHGLGPLHEGDLDDYDAMIASNVTGLLYLTRAVSPGMVARQRGHIINIGSIAGRVVYPGGAVYCATKFAVDALTQGMRQDFNPAGIKVTAIDPGMVESEFSLVRFKGDETRAAGVYQGLTPLTPADVADAIVYALTRPAHVVVADLLLLPLDQASAQVVRRR